MNKKITIAMLLLLMQTVMYSGQTLEGEDWQILDKQGNQVMQPAPTDQTRSAILSSQTNANEPEEASAACCAAVAGLVIQALQFFRDQAYGQNQPFAPQQTETTKKVE